MTTASGPAGANEALVTAIRHRLAAHGDPTRAVAQQAYMKSSMPFRGITAPDLRRLMRSVLADGVDAPASREQWESTIRTLWDGATHREERYAALAVARHAGARPSRAAGALDLYRHLVETGAWWDLVDEVATHLVRDELLAYPARVGTAMRAWSTDADLWVRRAAILCQVGAGDDLDLGLLRDVIVPNLEGTPTSGAGGRQDFFIRKAIGWALRDAARRRPEWVRSFVDEHRTRMSGLTQREALKRIGAR